MGWLGKYNLYYKFYIPVLNFLYILKIIINKFNCKIPCSLVVHSLYNNIHTKKHIHISLRVQRKKKSIFFVHTPEMVYFHDNV